MSSTSSFAASWIDPLGGVASTLCVVHCVLQGVVPALLSGIGLGGPGHEALEWGFFAVAIGLALVASAQRLRGRSPPWVLVGLTLGVALLVLGRFGEAFALHTAGEWFAILGGLLLAVSHLASPRCEQGCSEAVEGVARS